LARPPLGDSTCRSNPDLRQQLIFIIVLPETIPNAYYKTQNIAPSNQNDTKVGVVVLCFFPKAMLLSTKAQFIYQFLGFWPFLLCWGNGSLQVWKITRHCHCHCHCHIITSHFTFISMINL
jgi:hypothetical protein